MTKPENFMQLSIVAQHSDFMIYQSQQITTAIRLNVGTQTLQKVLQTQPPTAQQVEDAIVLVEDQIMSNVDVLQPFVSLPLFVSSPALQHIAQLAFAEKTVQGYQLTTAQTEQLFSRFARVINGDPAKAEGLPETAEFAAYLILIREYLHHFGFASLMTI